MSRALEVLVVYEKLPEPRACGSDLRLVQLLEELARSGQRVHFLGRNPAGDERDHAELAQLCERVLGPDPERIHWGELPHARLDLDALLATTRFDAVLLDQFFWTGLSVAEQYLPRVRAAQPATPIVLVSDDCHWLREERRALRESSRTALERSRAMHAKERWTCEQADLVAAITPDDRARLEAEFPAARVRSLAFCQTGFPEHVPAFEPRAGLVFLGSGGNDANIQGLRWFVREVLPLVRARLPRCELEVVGAPPEQGWGVEDAPGVRVLGRLDELAPVFGRARVFVSPVAYGTGIKTKNVQALAHGLPLVLNEISAEGMQLARDQAGWVREDAASFAAAVIRLHEDRGAWEASSRASLQHARDFFGRERVAADLGALLDEAVSSPVRITSAARAGPGTEVELRFPELRDARKLSLRYTGLLNYSRELSAQGRYAEAVQQARNVFCELVCARVEERVYAETHALLASHYARQGELREASLSAREALRILPPQSEAVRPALERVAALAS